MEGAALREKHRFDLVIAGAWHTEAFARTKRLKKLSAYQNSEGRESHQDPIVGLTAMFASLQAKGKFAKITRH